MNPVCKQLAVGGHTFNLMSVRPRSPASPSCLCFSGRRGLAWALWESRTSWTKGIPWCRCFALPGGLPSKQGLHAGVLCAARLPTCLSPAPSAGGWWPEGREVSEGPCLPEGGKHLGLEEVPPPWLRRCDKK